MITTSHDNGLQSSSFSAGVEAFLTVTSSSTSNLGSTVTTSFAAGCILAFSKGIRIRITRQAIKFHGERTVLSIPMDSVRAPPVAAVTASVTSVIVRGIEPDRPACHTTKPEYAEAINRR